MARLVSKLGTIVRKFDAVFLDMAGTSGDKRNKLVIKSFQHIFNNHPKLTGSLIAQDLGLKKDPHIRRLHQLLRLRCNDYTVKRKLNEFEDHHDFLIQTELKPVPGAEKIFKQLHAQGRIVAYTTGFSRRLANSYVRRLVSFGIHYDDGVSSDEVKNGRPFGDMIEVLLNRFKIRNPRTVLNVGDAVADVKSAINAGVVAGAVTRTGSLGRTATSTLRKAGAEIIMPDITHLKLYI